jgi:flagellar assembly protein FliH
MAQMAKFLFDVSFDDGAGRAAAAPAIAPRISAEQLADAVARARAEGFAAGQAQARTAAEGEAARALAAIAEQLAGMAAARTETEARLRAETVQLATAIAGKLAAALLRREPAAEIEALILACLAEVRDEPRLVVRVAPAAVDMLRERIDGLAAGAGYAGKMVLLADDGLAAADCRIEWADGGAERNQAAIEARIEAAIDRYLQRATT